MASIVNKDTPDPTNLQQLPVEHVLETYWTRICQAIYQLVGDWDEAEDLALETFLRFHQQPPPDSTNPGGWLYRVATNLGLNALRAHQRRRYYESLYTNPVLQDEPSRSIEKAQEIARVRWVLGQMKPQSAQLLLLRYHGLSYKEIAEHLQIRYHSIGTLLARATRAFEALYRQAERD